MYMDKDGMMVLETGDPVPVAGVWMRFKYPKCARCDERNLIIRQLEAKVADLEAELVTNRRKYGENGGNPRVSD